MYGCRRVCYTVLDPDGRDVDGVRRGHCRRLHCHLRRLPDIPLPIQAQPTGLIFIICLILNKQASKNIKTKQECLTRDRIAILNDHLFRS